MKYDKTTGELAIGEKDGTIKTLHKPRYNHQFETDGRLKSPPFDWKKLGYEQIWLKKVKE